MRDDHRMYSLLFVCAGRTVVRISCHKISFEYLYISCDVLIVCIIGLFVIVNISYVRCLTCMCPIMICTYTDMYKCDKGKLNICSLR